MSSGLELRPNFLAAIEEIDPWKSSLGLRCSGMAFGPDNRLILGRSHGKVTGTRSAAQRPRRFRRSNSRSRSRDSSIRNWTGRRHMRMMIKGCLIAASFVAVGGRGRRGVPDHLRRKQRRRLDSLRQEALAEAKTFRPTA